MQEYGKLTLRQKIGQTMIKLDALWHWHPRCTVAIEGQDVRTVDPDVGNMRITPVAGSRVFHGPHSVAGWVHREW
jgi:hypothetical protein